jgi:hypothetical protein
MEEPAADAAPAAVAVPPAGTFMHSMLRQIVCDLCCCFFCLVNGCSDNADHYVLAEQRGSEGERERRKETERERGERNRGRAIGILQ